MKNKNKMEQFLEPFVGTDLGLIEWNSFWNRMSELILEPYVGTDLYELNFFEFILICC
jgi:hypothetical protein